MSVEARLAHAAHNMVPGPAAVDTPHTIWATEDGIMISYGNVIPSDNSVGYAPGCIFIHVDGTTVSRWYGNIGTKAAANFNLMTVAAG
jgi:hypothetical protein